MAINEANLNDDDDYDDDGDFLQVSIINIDYRLLIKIYVQKHTSFSNVELV